MKCVVFLMAEEVVVDADGRVHIHRPFDGLGTEGFPAAHTLWVYTNLILDRAEEGIPVEMHLELISPTGAKGSVTKGTGIGPVRKDPEMPSVWALQFNVTVTDIPSPGLYHMRLSANDEVVAERPLLIAQA